MLAVNKLDIVFKSGKRDLLNIYCTAGFPQRNSMEEVILSLQDSGVDMVEIGMPYSDPIADGPVIQKSNMAALRNGMNLSLMFEQLESIKHKITIPIILMGYLNPVLQYGVESFCLSAEKAGVSGVIIPDLPMLEFNTLYKKWFDKHSLKFIFLVSPDTDKKRMHLADKLSGGFLYAVSSSSVTGQGSSQPDLKYFEKLQHAKLKNPLMIGFGIHNRKSFETACSYARGAIIGSAYINALNNGDNIKYDTRNFVSSIIGSRNESTALNNP